MRDLLRHADVPMARLRRHVAPSHRRPPVDVQPVPGGMTVVNRNGSRWHDAPRGHGLPKTLCNRWKRWSDPGVFVRIMAGLAAEVATPGAVMIDVEPGPRHWFGRPGVEI